jgi:hypothetical protein
MRFRLPTVFCAFVGAFASALLLAHLSGPARAEGPESVQQLVGAPGHTVWQITRPRVNAPSTEYPQITFKPGSTVTVNASGCVQTGGKGLTWKRYVDPTGDKSDKLYHGEISIPGATNGLEFFKPAQPTVYTIPAGATVYPGSHLRLGYTDDGYSDNGYDGHDDGDLNQCRGLGDAVVVIDIGPLQTVGAAPTTASYYFTLENITIQHLRSVHTDTDVLAAGVVVDGTQSNVARQELGKLKPGSHAVNFSVLVDTVTPTDRVAISYVVANEGHSDPSTDQLLAGAVGKTGLTGSNGGSALAAIAGLWAIPFDLLNPNCDGPVAAGVITATGTELFDETQTGRYERTVSFPGVKSADGCGPDSFYQLTYAIAPVTSASSIEQSFALKVDAKSKALQTGSNVQMIGK